MKTVRPLCKLLHCVAFLFLLSACGDSVVTPSALPDPSAPPISASPTDTPKATDVYETAPQATAAPTTRPAFDPGGRRPTHPFPTLSPPQVQFVSNELHAAYREGDFVVTADGFATNYQAWHSFITQADKGLDAAMRVFHSEIVEEDAGIGRYQVTGRYYLSVRGGEAVWSDFQNKENYANGTLSVNYDADTGLHELFVGDSKVLHFVYIPPDSAQIALYWGFMPLEELPLDYSAEDATQDGCLVIQNKRIQNVAQLSRYPTSSEGREGGSFLRVFIENDEGVTITDIGAYQGESEVEPGFYCERVCVTVDYARRNLVPEEKTETLYCDSSYMKVEQSSEFRSIAVYSDLGADTLYIIRDMLIAHQR